MQGKIISFNGQDNSGSIIADNGVQYVFSADNWIEQYLPKAGDNIDFSFDSTTGSINRVSYQANAYASSAVPPHLPNGLSDGLSNGLSNDGGRQSPSALSLQKASQDRYAPPSHSYEQGFNHQHEGTLGALYAKEENYNIIDWTKKVVFENYATFSGRARRKEYWLFYLATIIISIIFGFIEGLMGVDYDDVSITSIILSLVFFLPTLAVGARRLHDTGRSGWWQLLWFIPIIGWILIIIWLATDTSPETNRWGQPARRV